MGEGFFDMVFDGVGGLAEVVVEVEVVVAEVVQTITTITTEAKIKSVQCRPNMKNLEPKLLWHRPASRVIK